MDEMQYISSYLDELTSKEGNSITINRSKIEKVLQAQTTIRSGIIIRILIVLGGFLSACFFLLFIFTLGLDKTLVGMILFGLFSIYGSIWLYTRTDQLIFESICVSFFITGFLLIGIALGRYHLDQTVACMIYCVLSVLALVLTKNYLMVIVSVLNIFGSLLTCILLNKSNILFQVYNPLLILLFTFFSLRESFFVTFFRKTNENFNPIRLGLIFSYLLGMIIIMGVKVFPEGDHLIWISSIVNGFVLLLLLHNIFSILGISNKNYQMIISLLCALFLLAVIKTPAIFGSIIIFLVCFMVKEKIGFVAGVLACIYFILQYYYDLQYSLLIKSEIFLSIGFLFFLLYFITQKKLVANEKV